MSTVSFVLWTVGRILLLVWALFVCGFAFGSIMLAERHAR